MPKTAILQKGGDFIFCFLLRQKSIPVDSIQFVHYPEIGSFANRGNDIFSSLHILKHDIRTLTITYTENGATRQFHLVCIRDASAAAAAIDSIVKQHRRTWQLLQAAIHAFEREYGRISARIPLFLPECLCINPTPLIYFLYRRKLLIRQNPELPFQHGRGKQRRKFRRTAKLLLLFYFHPIRKYPL